MNTKASCRSLKSWVKSSDWSLNKPCLQFQKCRMFFCPLWAAKTIPFRLPDWWDAHRASPIITLILLWCYCSKFSPCISNFVQLQHPALRYLGSLYPKGLGFGQKLRSNRAQVFHGLSRTLSVLFYVGIDRS